MPVFEYEKGERSTIREPPERQRREGFVKSFFLRKKEIGRAHV